MSSQKGRGPPSEAFEQLSLQGQGRGRARGPPPGLGGRGVPPPGFGGPRGGNTAGGGRATRTSTSTPGETTPTPGRSSESESETTSTTTPKGRGAPRGLGKTGRAPARRGQRGQRGKSTPKPDEEQGEEQQEEDETTSVPSTYPAEEGKEVKGGLTTTESEKEEETEATVAPSEAETTESDKKEKKEKKDEKKEKEEYDQIPHSQRPDLGKRGKPISLSANLFRMKYEGMQAFLYDVKIEPELKSKKLRRMFILHVATLEGLKGVNPIYDGQALLFSVKPIQSRTWPLKFEVKDEILDAKRERPPPKGPPKGGRPPRGPRIFKILIAPSSLGKGTGEIDMTTIETFINGKTKEAPRLALQALDVAMRYEAQQKYHPIGRNIFYPLEEGFQSSLGGGGVLWLGHFQTVRAAQAGLMLNVDTAATAMIDPTLVTDYLRARFGKNPEFPKNFNHCLRALRGLQVHVTHRGPDAAKKRFRITSIARVSASKEFFELQDKRQTNVASYFKEKYNIDLKFPHYPCLKVGAKGNCLPMEVCRIAIGQRQKQAMSNQQRQVMIQETCLSPYDRQNMIYEGVPDDSKNPYMREFGLKLSKEMIKVTGRILPPPELKYLDERSGQPVPTQPQRGTWQLRGLKFINPKPIASCPIFIFGTERDTPTQYADGWFKRLAQTCTMKGLKWSAPIKMNRAENSAAGVKKVFDYLQTLKPKPQIVFCFLKSSKEHIYRYIKRSSETELGVVTQCVDYTKATNQKVGGPAYQANIALKMNAKLGGTHTIVQPKLPLVSDKPTLVMGADVHHPGIGNTTGTSISAVLGSCDTHCTTYATIIQEQVNRVEYIQGMEAATKWQILNYQKLRNTLPEQIIVYRDGVGEGAFDEIMSREVKAIKRACETIQDGYAPKVTFLIVQKRNHIRFFLEDPREGDKEGRLPPGTVVDSHVCSPHDFDFFMCSHAGLKGTSKPTHYHVLYDENKFSADKLLELTYDLCHIYQRCTRSVSYPAPAYYAHLASYRARLYRDEEDSEESETASKTESEGSGPQETPIKALPQLMPAIQQVLYYA